MIKYLALICLLVLSIGCKTVYVSDTVLDYERVSENSPVGDDKITKIIEPYRLKLSAQMDEVIGELEVSLTKQRPESDIGNWLADMLYTEAKILNDGVLDFAVQNHGGVRVSSMSAGPITIGEIYEIMPFDNLISIITADGKGTKAFLDHIAIGKGWPVSSQLRFQIKDKQATEITINNEPLKENQIYHFAIPDYIAGGGSGSVMLKEFERKDLGVLIRDAFIQHIKKDTEAGITQTAKLEGRIKNLDHE